MKNKIKLFGIIAIVAIIGLSMTACGDGGGDDPTFSMGNSGEETISNINTYLGLSGSNAITYGGGVKIAQGATIDILNAQVQTWNDGTDLSLNQVKTALEPYLTASEITEVVNVLTGPDNCVAAGKAINASNAVACFIKKN